MSLPSSAPIKISQVKTEWTGSDHFKDYYRDGTYVKSTDTNVSNISTTADGLKLTQFYGSAKASAVATYVTQSGYSLAAAAWDGAVSAENYTYTSAFGTAGTIESVQATGSYAISYAPAAGAIWVDRAGTNIQTLWSFGAGTSGGSWTSLATPNVSVLSTDRLCLYTAAQAYDEDYTSSEINVTRFLIKIV